MKEQIARTMLKKYWWNLIKLTFYVDLNIPLIYILYYLGICIYEFILNDIVQKINESSNLNYYLKVELCQVYFT